MATQFYEIEAPRQMSFGSSGGRLWSTTENKGFSGWAQWNENWRNPLGQWTVTVKSQQNSDGRLTDYDIFHAFWMNMRGKARGFRFNAPGDNQATGEYIGTGDGVTLAFQLQRTYAIIGGTCTVPITKPITSAVLDYLGNPLSDTVVVYQDGNPVTVTVDATTGLITFASAPLSGALLTASCKYHFPVHFASDHWNAQVEASFVRGGQALFNVASMEINEVRVSPSAVAPAGAITGTPSVTPTPVPIVPSPPGAPTGNLGADESVGTTYNLADLTNNNTSAANSWSDSSTGDALPGDVSKVSIKKALYSGATTRVLEHAVAWFNGGTNSHIDVGYADYSGSGTFTGDSTQIAAMIADMKSRGSDGVILDWYGQGSHSDAVALAIKTACEADGVMKFAICIDKGATGLSGSTPTSAFETNAAYVQATYYPSSAYEKRSGRPLLLEFGCEKFAIDWTAVKTYLVGHGNPFFMWQDLTAPTGTSGISGGTQNAFKASFTDGVFSWVGVSGATTTDPEALNYLKGFYTSAQKYPLKLAMGSVRKGFNDALASWGEGRVLTQANGSTWFDSFGVLNSFWSSSKQLPYLQVATWDDYEEGSEIETGIATDLAFASASATGNTLNWATTGNLRVFDHFGIYASSDAGATYKFLGLVAQSLVTVDLKATLGLTAGSYLVRIRAVGITSIQNLLSSDVSVTIT